MLSSILQRGSKDPRVVVEIGNDWLKILEFNPAQKRGQVTRASLIKLVQIKEPVTIAISKAFKNLKLPKQNVTVCIPRHLVTIRILEFPSTDPKEISNMVTLQVGKQTPYSREEIIYSYRPINVEREGYTKVMLVIARKNIVNARVDSLQKAGIEVGTVAVSSEGVFNWFTIGHSQQIDNAPEGIILLDVDSNYSDYIVVHRGQFAYTRNILIGANHLLDEPEQWMDKFIEEVNHSTELYHNEEREVKLTKIYLSGAARNIPGFDVHLNMKLNIDTECANPFNKVNMNPSIRVFASEECAYVSPSPIVGMAIKNKELFLDLTSSELRMQKDMEVKRRQITLMGILFAAIITVGSLVLLVSMYTKNSYLNQIKKQIAQIEKEAGYVERMRKHIDLVEGRLDAKQRSINVLYEIHNLTPKEIHYTNINIEEKKQTILQGRAKAMDIVFSFVPTLEASSYFEGVKTTYATSKKEEGENYVKFEIVCMYEEDNDFEEEADFE